MTDTATAVSRASAIAGMAPADFGTSGDGDPDGRLGYRTGSPVGRALRQRDAVRFIDDRVAVDDHGRAVAGRRRRIGARGRREPDHA